MDTLGVVMAYEGKKSLTSDRYFSPILDGIFAASKSGRQKTMVIIEDNWGDIEKNLLSYLDGHCDGLIFILPLLPSAVFRAVQKRKVPFVMVGEARPEPFLSTVDVDNVQAAFDVVRLLIEAGHRRIAFLAGNEFLLSSAQRETGYRQALDRAGLELQEEFILPGQYSAESGYERTRQLLRMSEATRPTAVFCGDDSIAHGACRALREGGLRFPEEMSLVGINDDKEAAGIGPGLTTVRQPLYAIGEASVELLLEEIAGGAEPGTKKLLPGEIILRGSIASPLARI